MKKEEVLPIMIELSEQIETGLSVDQYDLCISLPDAQMIQTYTSLIDPCTKKEELEKGCFGYLWNFTIKISSVDKPEFKLKEKE